MTMLSRRQLILGSIAVSIAAPSASAVASVTSPDSDKTARLVKQMLHQYFEEEEAAHVAIGKFATSFASQSTMFDALFGGRLAGLLARLPYSVFRRIMLLRDGNSLHSRVRLFETHVLTTFLLSIDYFRSDDPDKKQHKFEQVYDPYDSACQNPLAKTLA